MEPLLVLQYRLQKTFDSNDDNISNMFEGGEPADLSEVFLNVILLRFSFVLNWDNLGETRKIQLSQTDSAVCYSRPVIDFD